MIRIGRLWPGSRTSVNIQRWLKWTTIVQSTKNNSLETFWTWFHSSAKVRLNQELYKRGHISELFFLATKKRYPEVGLFCSSGLISAVFYWKVLKQLRAGSSSVRHRKRYRHLTITLFVLYVTWILMSSPWFILGLLRDNRRSVCNIRFVWNASTLSLACHLYKTFRLDSQNTNWNWASDCQTCVLVILATRLWPVK